MNLIRHSYEPVGVFSEILHLHCCLAAVTDREGADPPHRERSTDLSRAIPELAINPQCFRESMGRMWGLYISISTSAPDSSHHATSVPVACYTFFFTILNDSSPSDPLLVWETNSFIRANDH